MYVEVADFESSDATAGGKFAATMGDENVKDVDVFKEFAK